MRSGKYAVCFISFTICQLAFCQNVPTVVCDVEVKGGNALVEINKFPVVKIDQANDNQTSNIRINNWVCNGTNEIKITFNPSITPVTDLKKHGFSLKVVKTKGEGTTNVLRETLVRIPRSIATTNTVFVIQPFPLKSQDLPWLATPPVSLASADRSSILALVTQLKNALVAKDKNTLKSLYAKRNSIMAISQGLSISQIEQAQSSFYDIAFEGQTYTVLPVEMKSLIFRSATNANLVTVVSPKGADPIILDLGDETTLEVPVVVSKDSNNTWILVQ